MDNGRGVIFRVNRDAVAADGGDEVTPRIFIGDAPGLTQYIGTGELDFKPPHAEEFDDRPGAGTRCESLSSHATRSAGTQTARTVQHEKRALDSHSPVSSKEFGQVSFPPVNYLQTMMRLMARKGVGGLSMLSQQLEGSHVCILALSVHPSDVRHRLRLQCKSGASVLSLPRR
jgi:hypothetical protein